ncbi:uncharacterized protein LOC125193165 [Salvia hispanica]|uniref:uncharacterized protein LOC125193165 n=1 Tax=Salvia hispanica TaxID=49212 RepID=UPI002009901B|nr:uncharacterized protein LOC125193165 [Salvia hispanica]
MDISTSEVGRSTGSTGVRSSTTLSNTSVSAGSGNVEPTPIATMFEHILASLARFETRMDDFDRRLVPPRSGTTHSLGLPSHWFTDALPKSLPNSIPTQSVVTSIPPPPRSSWEQSGSGTGIGGGNLTVSSALPPFSMPSLLGSFGSGSQASTGPLTSWDPPGFTQGVTLPSGRQQTSWDNPDVAQSRRSASMGTAAGCQDETTALQWLRRCELDCSVQYYFDHLMMPEAYRLHYAVMLFEQQAAEWVFNYRASNPIVLWHDFLEDVRRHFDPQSFEDYLGLIAKLVQTGSLADYNATFESMRNRIPNIPESTFLPIYIAGLQQPVQSQVKHSHPRSVAAAMAFAIEFDCSVEKPAAQPGPQRRNWPPRDQKGTPAAGPQQPQSQVATRPVYARGPDYSKLPVIHLTAAQRADRTRRGLCVYCEEKWVQGHACKRPFLAYMGAEDGEETEETDMPTEHQEPKVITTDLSHIYAMEGRQRPEAMEFKGTIGANQVVILVDTGSSHDFLHPRVAQKLSLPLTAIKPFRVYVGNGESLVCSHASLQTRVVIQSQIFLIDLHILPVHGLDVILGLAWLKSLRRVTSDFVDGTLEFIRNGIPIRLKVAAPLVQPASLKVVARLLTLKGAAELFEMVTVAGVDDLNPTVDPPQFSDDLDPMILAVLRSHEAVFRTPTGVPPPRPLDHRIHLLPNSKPVNVRPYRYPYFQKNEIEKQVKEMLASGVIRPSHSSFSSPVLLIRKKDGSFRFCIDYRALNTITVPDHFPIPTSDELFDELGAARFFTKLDLRSGYHQIRMHADDVFKTAFRTHDGHFEFLVMPFGLTNAPSTFQSAMNTIFRPLLRLFVIVFFDDILVYSPTLESHVRHLHEVLMILKANFFLVKLSKCTFCSTKVEYLGHLISAGQLKADPEKIAAMVAWPAPSSVKQLRGFLGLTGYYRRFVANYATIAGPLTELLKKDAFTWSAAADDSFQALKTAMTSAPVLRLPDFSKVFCIETDASDFGVGAVLLQEGHPLASVVDVPLGAVCDSGGSAEMALVLAWARIRDSK